jgi:NRPS condensation-like uncharacterized protein
MASGLLKWVASHPKSSAAIVLPLASLAVAAAAVSWSLGRPKKPLQFSPDGLTRPLSELDAWYSSKNLAHLIPHFYIAATLTGSPWTHNEAQILLSRVMARHPLSMCTIVDQDDGITEPYWRRLWHPSYAHDEQGIIDIRFEERATSDEKDDTWKSVARKHEDEGFSVTRPLHTIFRLIIVSKQGCPHFEIIFFPHHAVCDARGASYFVRQLLEEWAVFQAEGASSPTPVDLTRISIDNIPVTGGKSSTSAEESPKSVIWPTPVENLTRTAPGLWFLLKVLAKDKIPFLRPKDTAWIGPVDRGVVLRPSPTTCWLQIPSSKVEALKTLCRSRKTTVNGALWSAVIFALLHVFIDTVKAGKEEQTGTIGRSPDSTSFSLHVPIDLRSRLGISDTIMAPMVTGVEINCVAHGNMSFWDVAAEVNEKVAEGLPEAITTNGMARYVPKPSVPWLFERETRPPNGRTDTMKISNLGMVNFDDRYGDLQLRDVWFARHGMREALLFSMTVITPGPDRSMNIVINGTKELINDRDVENLKTYISAVLKHAITSGDSGSFTYNDLYKLPE